MGRSRRIVNRALGAFVVVFAVMCFGLLGFLGIGPRTGRYSTLTVLSGSMRPVIPVGAMVVDTPEPASALRVGQIVTYAMPVADHQVVTHRVVRIIGGTAHPAFQTKGDANDAADPWLTPITSVAVWRVRAVVPRLGYVIHRLRNPAIRVVGIAVLPALLALWWAVSIWRDDDDDAVVRAS